ncbi:MAG: helix-turn-helix transcriptional regulator [Bacteroidales bacterium]|nr:helix-turn-helix transcriptional regulator [Bacteroidales bacterium]
MKKQLSLGKQIMLARQQNKLSQVELANKCNLYVRTIQRIENEEVNPRLYTLRIIGETLGVTLMNEIEIEDESRELIKLRSTFEKRKQIRIYTFAFAMFLFAAALLLCLSGIARHSWAPFFYILFFLDLIVIVIIWRCPGCNGLLGDFFNIKYCSKCGLKFYSEKSNL